MDKTKFDQLYYFMSNVSSIYNKFEQYKKDGIEPVFTDEDCGTLLVLYSF